MIFDIWNLGFALLIDVFQASRKGATVVQRAPRPGPYLQ